MCRREAFLHRAAPVRTLRTSWARRRMLPRFGSYGASETVPLCHFLSNLPSPPFTCVPIVENTTSLTYIRMQPPTSSWGPYRQTPAAVSFLRPVAPGVEDTSVPAYEPATSHVAVAPDPPPVTAHAGAWPLAGAAPAPAPVWPVLGSHSAALRVSKQPAPIASAYGGSKAMPPVAATWYAPSNVASTSPTVIHAPSGIHTRPALQQPAPGWKSAAPLQQGPATILPSDGSLMSAQHPPLNPQLPMWHPQQQPHQPQSGGLIPATAVAPTMPTVPASTILRPHLRPPPASAKPGDAASVSAPTPAAGQLAVPAQPGAQYHHGVQQQQRWTGPPPGMPLAVAGGFPRAVLTEGPASQLHDRTNGIMRAAHAAACDLALRAEARVAVAERVVAGLVVTLVAVDAAPAAAERLRSRAQSTVERHSAGLVSRPPSAAGSTTDDTDTSSARSSVAAHSHDRPATFAAAATSGVRASDEPPVAALAASTAVDTRAILPSSALVEIACDLLHALFSTAADDSRISPAGIADIASAVSSEASAVAARTGGSGICAALAQAADALTSACREADDARRAKDCASAALRALDGSSRGRAVSNAKKTGLARVSNS